MYSPLIYKIIAPFLLVVFAITSCNVFVMPEPDTITVPIGKGNLKFVYLDEDYQPTVNDIGKMAMYVEKNELAKDVLVMAEIRNDNIDNDVVVRVINKQNNSLVSFFYYKDQYFPHKVVITIDGETIIGQFSLYSPLSETYSVEFNYKTGESENYNNLILNKNVFSLHKKDYELTDTQNIRISHIITTLALWNSLAYQIDDNFNVGGRGIKWKSIAKIFTVVSVVSFAAVVILASPTVVTIIGAVIPEPVITTVMVTTSTVSVTAGATAVVAGIMSLLDPEQEDDSNKDRRPMIQITLNSSEIKNNGMPPYYLDKGESLIFDLKITDKGNNAPNEIIDKNNIKDWFDPYSKIFIKKDGHQYNAFFFDVNIDGDIEDILHIVVSRNYANGKSEDGMVQLVLKFRKNVIINGKGDGINFWDGFNNPVNEKKDIFVINFTVEEP